ncbi:MAG TPA: phosphoenolpyruvate synthase, partial [Candidatus Aenigmarchaeota archaeon]|nr:phosphoenolpyruvate synthase [Candidatus Aenigmarchaeota archaeon]HEX33043.1 phosphoenolpyruvate synthase [Candidatus Aenigmarchaeota archaeon]
VGLCAVVQVMVNAEKAGVAFSVNPATNNEDEIVIEAAFGLGEAVVSGAVTPDLYIVDKKDMRIKSKTVSKKEFKIVRDIQTGKNVKVYLSDSQASSQVLSDEEIIKIASILRDIEKHYDFPQDTEWAIEGDKIYFVQSRPVTTLKSKKSSSVQTDKPPILKGLGASPGAASGPVKIVHDISELDKVKQGDVLVTRMTNPDMVPAMKKASAIVTDEGGMTSHAAIVSREMGIPCVVGTGEATNKLKEEQIVTVDGSAGLVYEGKVEVKSEEEEIPYYETKTKIYMNLGEPELIDKYKDLYFDGIGLMRVEFIITSYVKAHPLALIKQGKSDLYVEKLAEGIEKVAKAIYPKPVVVRFSDFKTNEYKSLEGGEEFEPVENNPMLGWRGVSRYISPNFEPAFRLECKAIKLVRDKGLDNVWVMLPFVRTLWEVEKVLKIMESEGLKRDDKFKVWIMAEVPAVAFLADKFADYCDGFSIGSNDLTQLVLGVDRDSELLGKAGYFDERNEAVKEAIKSIIDKAHSKGVTVSICGQAPSVYPEFTEFLVKHGVDSVSVSPDMVNKTRKRIHEIESSQ